MPPWFADPHYGKFSNDRSLLQSEIDTIVNWVDAGAPQGNPKDMPPPRQFAEGWAIPKQVVIELAYHADTPITRSFTENLRVSRIYAEKVFAL